MRMFETVRETVMAEQLTPSNADELARLCGGQVITETSPRDPNIKYVALNVPTLSGVKRMSQNQMLIQYPEGAWDVMGATAFTHKFVAV